MRRFVEILHGRSGSSLLPPFLMSTTIPCGSYSGFLDVILFHDIFTRPVGDNWDGRVLGSGEGAEEKGGGQCLDVSH